MLYVMFPRLAKNTSRSPGSHVLSVKAGKFKNLKDVSGKLKKHQAMHALGLVREKHY